MTDSGETLSHQFLVHPLAEAFFEAWRQAAKGKGQRHGGDVTPFLEQTWVHVANAQGTGFLTGQAAKKLTELGDRVVKGDGAVGDEAWTRELLGATVYLGMAYLHGTGRTPGSLRPAATPAETAAAGLTEAQHEAQLTAMEAQANKTPFGPAEAEALLLLTLELRRDLREAGLATTQSDELVANLTRLL